MEAGEGDAETALRRSTLRIFSARPGARCRTSGSDRRKSLAGEVRFRRGVSGWSGYAYGEAADGIAARDLLETRLSTSDAVLHNQDNREHDILDSDDYYQFAGGLSAAVAHLSGRDVPVYHNDHSLAERRSSVPLARKSGALSAAVPATRNGSPARCATATRARSRWRRRSITCSLFGDDRTGCRASFHGALRSLYRDRQGS